MDEETGFFEKLINWPFEFSDLYYWFKDFVLFHYDTMGWKGVAIVIIGVCVVMFFFEPTRYFISLIYTSIFREFVLAPLKGLFATLFSVLKWLGAVCVSKTRDALRVIFDK